MMMNEEFRQDLESFGIKFLEMASVTDKDFALQLYIAEKLFFIEQYLWRDRSGGNA